MMGLTLRYFLTVTGPVDGLSIKEYDSVTVNWDADNIALDSALIWYSNNGGNEYLLVLLLQHHQHMILYPY